MLHAARRTIHSISNHWWQRARNFNLQRAVHSGIEAAGNAARAVDGSLQAIRPYYDQLRPLLEKHGVGTGRVQRALGNYEEIRDALTN